MKLALDKKQGARVEFIARGVSTSFANVLRRYALSRIPVLAIDSVTFYDNTSAFWDEYIAHRLGLMPIITPDKTPESAEIVFTLDAEGPKVAYASDMSSSDKEITIAKGGIPIVTLGQNQHLRFEAKAVLGTAQKHAKFQAGLLAYGAEGEDALRFMVEAFYQMEPADIVLRASDAIEVDIERIEAALGKKPEKKKAVAKKKVKKEVSEAKEEKAGAAEEKAAAPKEEKAEKKPKKAKAEKKEKAEKAEEGPEKKEEKEAKKEKEEKKE